MDIPMKDYHEAATRAQPDPLNKENRPPKGMKRTASVAGLFERGRRAHAKFDEERQNMISANIDTLFAPKVPRKKAIERDPHYMRFAVLTNEYREAAKDVGVGELDVTYEALVARIDGLDVDGNDLNISGVPTQHDIEALRREYEKSTQPLGNHQFKDKQGKTISLDIYMKQYIESLKAREAKLNQLLKHARKIDHSIKVARSNIAKDNDGAVSAADMAKRERMERIRAEMTVAKDEVVAEIESAQKEEKAMAREKDAKMQQFLKTMVE